MAEKLVKYEQYTRLDVHDIFDPMSPFTPRSGTWGLQGILPIPKEPKSFVFFVTLGQKQAGHSFDEGITEDGVLIWQSQPSQKLNDPVILDLINHDHEQNNIHLFFRGRKINPRTKKAELYTYLGKLAYVTHDNEKELPVHFKWQILDWDLTSEQAKNLLGIQLIEHQINQTTFIPLPGQRRTGASTGRFHGVHKDFEELHAVNNELGLKGEVFILQLEISNLQNAGRLDLAAQVQHTSQVFGDGKGYDILSYTPNGDVKYIEVKTTTYGQSTPFYMSKNELTFSGLYSENYYLYRVYNFDPITCTGNYYIIKGNVEDSFHLEPYQYKVYR
ncbi:DUF3427 domain-containing protein [Brevibacillus borstelensis]|uniref:DUF3427 domain-containing protein n=1 Tax=Brevibacillus borstelensis TaxID=45462 RepID=UPI0030BECBAE